MSDVLIVAGANIRDGEAAVLYNEIINNVYSYFDIGMTEHKLQIIELNLIGDAAITELYINLEVLSLLGINFGNFYFIGHGFYSEPSFEMGKTDILKGNYAKTGLLSEFFAGHDVFLLSCHTGGGQNLDNSSRFVQNLSDLWGANVFANRSWTRAAGHLFNGDPMSCITTLCGYDPYKTRTNACELSGQWLLATPNASQPSVIYDLKIYSQGVFLNNNYSFTKK